MNVSEHKRRSIVPINVLRKDIPKGEKPPGWSSTVQSQMEIKENESELSANEEAALWEAQEIGIVKWSGEDGKRYND